MTCQYPDLASSRVKSMELGRSGRMTSIVLLYHGNHLVPLQEQLSWPTQCTLWPLWWCLASLVYQALLCRLASSWLLLVMVGLALACSLPSDGCDILHQEIFLSLWIHLHTLSACILLWWIAGVSSHWWVMLLSVDCWMTGLTGSVATFTCSFYTALMVFYCFALTVGSWMWGRST